MNKILFFGIFAIALLLAGCLQQTNHLWNGLATGGSISSCQTLAGGAIYTLTSSVNGAGTTCFTVGGSNVALDCNGFTITNSSPAINSTYANTTIKNCYIANYTVPNCAGASCNSADSYQIQITGNNATLVNNTVTRIFGGSGGNGSTGGDGEDGTRGGNGSNIYGIYIIGNSTIINSSTVINLTAGKSGNGGNCGAHCNQGAASAGTAGSIYGVSLSGSNAVLQNNNISYLYGGLGANGGNGTLCQGSYAYHCNGGNGANGGNATALSMISMNGENISSTFVSNIYGGLGGNGGTGGSSVGFNAGTGGNAGAGGAEYASFLSSSSSNAFNTTTILNITNRSSGTAGTGPAGSGSIPVPFRPYGFYLSVASNTNSFWNSVINITHTTGNLSYGFYITTSANNSFFINYNNGSFFGDSAQNITSYENWGWFPTITSNGNDATNDSTTTQYTGSPTSYWYNGQVRPTAPVMTSARLSPTPTLNANDTLTAYCTGTDVNFDSLTYSYILYRNNVSYTTGIAGPYTQGVEELMTSVTGSPLIHASSWNIECWAFDGIFNSTRLNSSYSNVSGLINYIYPTPTNTTVMSGVFTVSTVVYGITPTNCTLNIIENGTTPAVISGQNCSVSNIYLPTGTYHYYMNATNGSVALITPTYTLTLTQTLMNYSAGISSLLFTPLHAFQHTVAPVNETQTTPLYVISNGAPYTRNLMINISNAIPNFDMYCSPLSSGGRIVHLSPTSQFISSIAPRQTNDTSCLQINASNMTTCGAPGGGSYSVDDVAWHDGNITTFTTLTTGQIYNATYQVSSYASNISVLLTYGNTSGPTSISVPAVQCIYGQQPIVFQYTFFNDSMGNGSDGSLTFTSTNKSYGNLVNGTDYTVNGSVLYLNLDRPYNFINFTLGPGTTLSSLTTNGTAMVVFVSGTATVSGTVSLGNILGVSVTSNKTIAGLNFSSTQARRGGTGGGPASTGGIGSADGYGGGGNGGGGDGTAGCGPPGTAGVGQYASCYGSCSTGAGSTPATGCSAGAGGSCIVRGYAGTSYCTAGSGGTPYGGSATGASGFGALGCVDSTGAGGAGGTRGVPAPHFYLSANQLDFEGVINTSGTAGFSGGAGSGSNTPVDLCGMQSYEGGGGGGGGGGDGGNIVLNYQKAIALTGTMISTGGTGGVAGIKGAVPATAGSNGINGQQHLYQTGLGVSCYSNYAWTNLFYTNTTQQTNRLYEAQANWTLSNQQGLQGIWCWADFNNPSPGSQGFNVSIDGVDP